MLEHLSPSNVAFVIVLAVFAVGFYFLVNGSRQARRDRARLSNLYERL